MFPKKEKKNIRLRVGGFSNVMWKRCVPLRQFPQGIATLQMGFLENHIQNKTSSPAYILGLGLYLSVWRRRANYAFRRLVGGLNRCQHMFL